MGRKVHPYGFRLGVYENWQSNWCVDGEDYGNWLLEDIDIRKYIKEKYFSAGISRIEINRQGHEGEVEINIYSARPGVIIGEKGSKIEELRNYVSDKIKRPVRINIREIRKAEIDAQLVAENIAMQIERRVPYRRVMKKSVDIALKLGAKGIKVACAGRLAGAEIARREWYREGRLPLSTLKSKINYAKHIAKTKYGVIGIKVWIYLGDYDELKKHGNTI